MRIERRNTTGRPVTLCPALIQIDDMPKIRNPDGRWFFAWRTSKWPNAWSQVASDRAGAEVFSQGGLSQQS